MEPDPAKIQAVTTYPVPPRNVKELREICAELFRDSRAFVQAYSKERASVQLDRMLHRSSFSSSFSMVKEAQAKDRYSSSVLEAVMQGKSPPELSCQRDKLFISTLPDD